MKLGAAQTDRAIGALLRLTTGDMPGAGYELARDRPNRRRWVNAGPGGNPGEWTDDTSMAIYIAKIASSGSLDPVPVGDAFLEWFHGSPKDVGVQTSAVLSRAGSRADLPQLAQEYYERHPNRSAGNGSLMRTAPVALTHLGHD